MGLFIMYSYSTSEMGMVSLTNISEAKIRTWKTKFAGHLAHEGQQEGQGCDEVVDHEGHHPQQDGCPLEDPCQYSRGPPEKDIIEY